MPSAKTPRAFALWPPRQGHRRAKLAGRILCKVRGPCPGSCRRNVYNSPTLLLLRLLLFLLVLLILQTWVGNKQRKSCGRMHDVSQHTFVPICGGRSSMWLLLPPPSRSASSFLLKTSRMHPDPGFQTGILPQAGENPYVT